MYSNKMFNRKRLYMLKFPVTRQNYWTLPGGRMNCDHLKCIKCIIKSKNKLYVKNCYLDWIFLTIFACKFIMFMIISTVRYYTTYFFKYYKARPYMPPLPCYVRLIQSKSTVPIMTAYVQSIEGLSWHLPYNQQENYLFTSTRSRSWMNKLLKPCSCIF